MQEYKRYKPFNKGLFTEKLGDLVMSRIADAERHGFVFTKRINKDRGEYVHKSCNSVMSFQFHHMRVGNIKCKVCQETKFKEESLTHGYLYLQQGEKKDTATYRHVVCGETSTFQIAHMRLGNVSCHHCIVSERKIAAKSHGYEWLSSGKSTDKYRHVVCGNVSEFSPHAMKVGNVRCNHCLELGYKKDALKHGYEWISRVGGVYSLYRHISCGHTQKKQVDAMRRGKVSCDLCEEGWYTKKSHLYLLSIMVGNSRWLKLGISGDVDRRLQRYGLPSDAEVMTLFVVEYRTGAEAIVVENALHKMFEPYCLPRTQTSKFMSNGFTECYDVSCTSEILKELIRIKESDQCQHRDLN